MDFSRPFSLRLQQLNKKMWESCRVEWLKHIPQLLFFYSQFGSALEPCLYATRQTLFTFKAAAGVNATTIIPLCSVLQLKTTGWWCCRLFILVQHSSTPAAESAHRPGCFCCCKVIVEYLACAGLFKLLVLFTDLAEEKMHFCLTVSPHGLGSPLYGRQQLVFVNLCLLNFANQSVWLSLELFGVWWWWFIWWSFGQSRQQSLLEEGAVDKNKYCIILLITQMSSLRCYWWFHIKLNPNNR